MYVITFNKDKTSPVIVKDLYDEITNKFPNEDFVVLPDGFSCMEMNKSELKQVVDKLCNYYNSLTDKEPNTIIHHNYPNKGDLIYMNLDGTDDKQYRVLKINETIAEVVAMSNATTIKFGSSQIYENSILDTYLNSTWYNTLTDTAKAAIVDKTFTQDSWYRDNIGSPVYNGYYGTTNPGTIAYSLSLCNSAFGNSITRHVYALSVQDVIDYISDTSFGGDGKLQNYNIWKMFWNDEVQHSDDYLWLRSAYASNSSGVFSVYDDSGRADGDGVGFAGAVRTAFQIDLSKIEWRKVDD